MEVPPRAPDKGYFFHQKNVQTLVLGLKGIASKMSDAAIPVSRKAARTFNPIRSIVDALKPPKGHPKRLLNMVSLA